MVNALEFRLKPLTCTRGFYGQTDCICFDTGAQVPIFSGRQVRVVNCQCWLETITTMQSFVNDVVRPITVRVSKCKGQSRVEAEGG